VHAGSGQRIEKFPFVETILRGMSEHSSQKKVCVERRLYLLKKKLPARSQNPSDLGYAALPVEDVMNDAEIDHSVEGFVPERQVLSVRDVEGDRLPVLLRETPACSLRKNKLQVKGRHGPEAHHLQEKCGPSAQAASDLKRIPLRPNARQPKPFIHFPSLENYS
jgi:hypothetical protein